MPCEKCGSVLVIGKKSHSRKLWCPKCSGYKILSKERAIALLRNQSQTSKKRVLELIGKFEKDSLLCTLMATRESSLSHWAIDSYISPEDCMSISDIILDVFKCETGNKKCNYFDDEFQELLAQNNSYMLSSKFIKYTELGYVSFIKIPEKDISLVAAELETILKFSPDKGFDKTSTKLVDFLKFTEKWVDVLENIEASGFASKTGVYRLLKENEKMMEKGKTKEFLQYVFLKINLEMACCDLKLIKFPRFKNNLRYIEVLKTLSETSFAKISINKYVSMKEHHCTLTTGNIKEIFYSFSKNNIPPKEYEALMDLLVFEIDKKPDFPIIYFSLDSGAYLIPPFTLTLIWIYLKGQYSEEIARKVGFEGYTFEDEILKDLKEIGIHTSPSNDNSIDLKNVKGHYNRKPLEIDIIGYKGDTIYIIECKHFIPTTDFLTGNREATIRNRLKDIDKKQMVRMQYVKSNLAKLGLESYGITHYKSVVITLMKEPIDKIGNTYLVSRREIRKIFSIPSIDLSIT